VVDSPRRLFSSELLYRHGRIEARLAAKFTDTRYITYTHDSRVPSFWLVDAGLAYQLPSPRWAEQLRLQLNISNLLDARYFSTVGSNGFVASDPAGTQHTLQVGPPRQVFLSLELGF
jgi:iron complex outermembrane receptor protein